MAKHAAILIRVSTDAQKEHGTSLPQQKGDLLRLAKSLGCTVTRNHIYDDGGYSGSQLSHSERPGLSELIKAAERQEFEIVLVQYVDRFGRTTLENLITRDKLKKLGIVIQSYFEGRMQNDPAGDLLFMFHSWKAEADNQQRRERSMLGRIAAARNGKHCMGHPPYGYKRDYRTKKLTVVRELAGWVRKFYEWSAVDGLSVREIARRANQLRAPLPSRRRKPHGWHRSTVHNILTHPAYIGTVTFRRWNANGTERPKEDWIEVSIPSIISEKLFERAQNRLRRNKETALRNTKRTYLYGGVIFCGYCRRRLGTGFQPERHEGRGTKYYHGLAKKEVAGACARCPQVAETRLEPVWNAIKNAISSPEYLRAKVTEYRSGDKTKTRQRLSELERQISTVSQQRKKLLSVYLTDDKLDQKEYLRLVRSIDAEMNRLGEEERQIEQRLHGERERLRLSEQISRAFQKIQQQVAAASYETQRGIIKKVVNKIVVYEREGEAEIEFNLAPVKAEAGLSLECTDAWPPAQRRSLKPSFGSTASSTTGRKWRAIGLCIKVEIRPARVAGYQGVAAA